MGQAKLRGTREQRVAEAIERNEAEARLRAEIERLEWQRRAELAAMQRQLELERREAENKARREEIHSMPIDQVQKDRLLKEVDDGTWRNGGSSGSAFGWRRPRGKSIAGLAMAAGLLATADPRLLAAASSLARADTRAGR